MLVREDTLNTEAGWLSRKYSLLRGPSVRSTVYIDAEYLDVAKNPSTRLQCTANCSLVIIVLFTQKKITDFILKDIIATVKP